MIRPRDILLALGLFSAKARAQVAVDVSYGHSLSGRFESGQAAQLQQQGLALVVDYVKPLQRGLLSSLQKNSTNPPDPNKPGDENSLSPEEPGRRSEDSMEFMRELLRSGEENFSLGFGLYAAQVDYKVGGISSSGTNMFLTVRGGWVLFLQQKTWLVQVNPELILYSHLSAASYSVAHIGSETIASSSVSTFSGFGFLRLPFYLGKQLNWKPAGKDLYGGGVLSYLMQNFNGREDATAATSPSTGAVRTISKSAVGSFPLRALTLELHATLLL